MSRSTPGLELVRLPADPSPVLMVTGEVDVYEAPAFKAELLSMVDEGHGRLVVDCAGMSFIDSAGVAALVDAHRRIEGHGGELVLRSLRPASRRIFEITDLVDLFVFEEPVG